MKRRNFLFTSATGLTGAAFFPSLLSGCTSGKDTLHDFGLIPLAGGASIAGLLGEGLQKNIDACHETDKKYLVCYWPWMDDGKSPTLDKVKFAVDECNRMAEVCMENGLRFAYHNHDQEFQTDGGMVLYEYILEQTVPELVTMELDFYWSYKGASNTFNLSNSNPLTH